MTEGTDHCVFQRLAVPNSDQNTKFRGLQAPEIDGIISAMHHHINIVWLEFGYFLNSSALSLFTESVAQELGVIVEAFDLKD